jgi:hypothetical protein
MLVSHNTDKEIIPAKEFTFCPGNRVSLGLLNEVLPIRAHPELLRMFVAD